MILRGAVITVLTLSVFLMMQGISVVWKGRNLPTMQDTGRSVPAEEVAPPVSPPDLQPQVGPNPPNLKPGYLFNEERTLEEPAAAKEQEAIAEKPVGIAADIEALTYAGSIIAETFRWALVSYPPPADAGGRPAAPPPSAGGKTQRAQPKPRAAAPKGGGAQERARLKEGDLIAGYQVAAIYPDKLVLDKKGERLEKFIYDSKKERSQPVRNVAPKTNLPPRPVAGPGGGAAAPPPPPLPSAPAVAPGTAAAGQAVSQPVAAPTGSPEPAPQDGAAQPAAAPAAPVPAAPAAPAPTTTPAAPVAAGAPAVSPPVPTRRLVVTRTTPPKPDTSRVVRGSRGGGVPMPAVPAVPAPGQ